MVTVGIQPINAIEMFDPAVVEDLTSMVTARPTDVRLKRIIIIAITQGNTNITMSPLPVRIPKAADSEINTGVIGDR